MAEVLRLDKIHAVGTGLSFVSGALVAANLAQAFDDPHLHDIAVITEKLRYTGQVSILDQAFVLYDLYQITNDPFAAGYGWNFWYELNGLD